MNPAKWEVVMNTQRTHRIVRVSAMGLMLGAAAMFNAGCATVTNGTTQAVSVSTHPSHATIETGGRTFESPCVIELARKRDHVVTISKPGYRTESVPLGRKSTGAVRGNIWIGGLFGWLIDAITGANNELVPGHIDFALTPDGSPTGGPVAGKPQDRTLVSGQ